MTNSPDNPGNGDFAPVERSTLLEFPTDYPLKILGRRHDDFAQAMLEIVLRHAPDFDAATTGMRASAQGNYLSLTVTIRAVSRQQLDDLYRELSGHPMVSMVF